MTLLVYDSINTWFYQLINSNCILKITIFIVNI